jgi:hypothetical protein
MDSRRLIVGKPATVGGVPQGPLPRSQCVGAMAVPVRLPRPVSVVERWLASATRTGKIVAEVLPVSKLIGFG